MDMVRFLKYVNQIEKGCWLWTGGKTNKGYGKCRFIDRTVDAHKMSYILFCDEVPAGMIVRHKCDVRLCVNPEHLIVGSYRDNMRDAKQRGRIKVDATPELLDSILLQVRGDI